MDLYEYFVPVVGHEDSYQVGNLGTVRSVDRPKRMWHGGTTTSPGRVLVPEAGKRGHLRVVLYRSGIRQRVLVHRIVLEAFVGPCPPLMEGCHGDGDAGNNRLSNLRWDTKPANMADSIRHGNHPSARRTHCPRQHPLTPENNVAASAKKGHRSCLACAREKTAAKNQNRPFDPVRADDRYAEILSRKAA